MGDPKGSERALARERKRQQAVFEALPDIVFLKDEKGIYVECNERLGKAFGTTRENMLGKSDYDIVPRDVADAFRARDRAAVASGQPLVSEEWVPFPDGTQQLCETIKTPLYEADGTLIGIIGIARDITARKHAETALRVSEERYRMLVDSLDDLVLSTSTDGRIAFVSAAIQSFGWSSEQVLGKTVSEVFRPTHPGASDWILSQDTGRAPREMRFVDGRGKTRFVRATMRAFTDATGDPGFIVVVSDLTRQFETEEQLRTNQKMEAVNRLAGGIAHDFNNLLAVIRSYAELAKGEIRDTDPVQSDIDEIIIASKRAEELTRQLLAFSRRQVLQPRPVDLSALRGKITRTLVRMLGPDVSVETDGDSEHEVLVDPAQLEQVLINLAGNARDAMPNGGKLSILIRDERVAEAHATTLDLSPGDYIVVTVRDTGQGMDPVTLGRVFEPFFTTKDVGKGTGLGLATVHGIVKQSGGAIRVDSYPGHGTAFEVYLPRYSGAFSALAASPHSGARGATKTVLLVEDEPALRKVVERLLVAGGYRVVVAADGDHAIALATQLRDGVDLLLTDVVMPEMNGQVVAQRVREVSPKVRVLYMSGYTGESIGQQGLEDEAFIQKPFDAAALRRKVRDVLGD